MPAPQEPLALRTARRSRDGSVARVAGLETRGVALGIVAGAGLGVVLGALVGGGPPLATWMVIGIGAGVAVGAARDEAARSR